MLRDCLLCRFKNETLSLALRLIYSRLYEIYSIRDLKIPLSYQILSIFEYKDKQVSIFFQTK